MSALTADKGHICAFFVAYNMERAVCPWLLCLLESFHWSKITWCLSQSTNHKAALHLLCTSVSERWGWGQRSVSIIMSPAHVPFMHPWLFKLCALAVKGMKLLPFHKEMNGAFMSHLWPKHLKGFVPQQIVSNSRENWSRRYFNAALLFTKKVQNSVSSKIRGIRQYSLSLHAISILLASTYPEALFYSQGHSCRVHLVLPGLERRLLL